MIITLKKDAPKQEVDKLIHSFEEKGLSVTMINGDNYNVFGLVGDTSKLDEKLIRANHFVLQLPIKKPIVYSTQKIVSLMFKALRLAVMKKS